MALLEVRDITVRFGGIVALDGLTFDIEEGQICGLIGPNGAGKTTMFNVVSRIYDATEGSITYDGKDLLSLPAHNMSKVGIYRTFQNLALWPGLTVLENVMVGDHSNTKQTFFTSALRIGTRKEEKDLRARAYAALKELDLHQHAFHPAAGLPFGTLKRIEIARALIGKPRLLLLDEPTLGLAPLIIAQIFEIIQEIRAQGVTVFLVEQNANRALSIADRGYVLETGRLVLEDTGANLLTNADVRKAYLGA